MIKSICINEPFRQAALVCALVALTLSSCSYPFSIKVSGDIDSKIKLTFHELDLDFRRSLKPVSYTITQLAVSEIGRRKEVGWEKDFRARTVWAVKGSQKLSEIEYGRNYPGFDVIVPAQSLSKNTLYLARANSRTTSGAAVTFFIDADGRVTEEAPPPVH